MKSPKPKNQTLYNRIKSDAKKKFKVWPSAYASGWVVKEYKRRGGTYTGKKRSSQSGLARWFAEKWVNVCTTPRKPCGRPGKLSISSWKKKYPYCRPSKRISPKTPKTTSELSKTELEKRCRKKRRSPLKRVLSVRKSRKRR